MSQEKKKKKKKTEYSFTGTPVVGGRFAESIFQVLDPYNQGADDIGMLKRLINNYKGHNTN